jgi:hypothetical protein
MGHLQEIYKFDDEVLLLFAGRPLVDDPMLSRFPRNTTIAKIVKEIMIERWNSSTSYDRFYESCAPSYCTYSKKIRTKTIIEVIITLLSLIGGLIVPLQIITPHLVKFIFRLFKWIMKKERHQPGNHYLNVYI